MLSPQIIQWFKECGKEVNIIGSCSQSMLCWKALSLHLLKSITWRPTQLGLEKYFPIVEGTWYSSTPNSAGHIGKTLCLGFGGTHQISIYLSFYLFSIFFLINTFTATDVKMSNDCK